MGDRGNISIPQGDGTSVWLYTHWTGSRLPRTLQAALRRGEDRWDDTPYLARIIFCEMITGSEGETTGFGISTSLQDNEYPLLVVDTANQQVRVEQAGDRERSHTAIGKAWGFREFVGLQRVSWETLG